MLRTRRSLFLFSTAFQMPSTSISYSKAIPFFQPLRHAWLNDFSVRQHHGEKQVLNWAASGVCKANEPMREWVFAEFRVLNTAKLQMIKRCHPIRRNPGRLLCGDGTRGGFRTRFKHVLKLSTALCLEPVAKQFCRTREDGLQEAAKNCGVHCADQ
jgi:hypothetical protein